MLVQGSGFCLDKTDCSASEACVVETSTCTDSGPALHFFDVCTHRPNCCGASLQCVHYFSNSYCLPFGTCVETPAPTPACTPYTIHKDRRCHFTECYNPDTCSCELDQGTTCTENPCDSPLACTSGFTCMPVQCNGCHFQCVEAPPAPVPAPVPTMGPCESDLDCGLGWWCRSTKGTDPVTGLATCLLEEKVCTKKQDEGASCGGFTVECERHACLEGLECACSEPTCDAPGVCTPRECTAATPAQTCETGCWNPALCECGNFPPLPCARFMCDGVDCGEGKHCVEQVTCGVCRTICVDGASPPTLPLI